MTTVGRAVDLFLILLSAIVIAIFISQLTSRLVSINLGNMFGMSRTRKRVDYILCGWNPISEAALSELQGTGSEIVIIDKENRPELAKAKDVHFIAGDPTNPDILKRSNITNAKNIVLAMDDDSEVLLAIHVIRDLNPWINIVAKINHHEHIKIAESAGADQVVSPSSIGGRLLSMVTEEPAAVEWLLRATAGERGMELKEYTVSKDSVFANRKIGQIRTELRDKAKIIGVDTVKGLEKVPSDDLVVEPGNKLLMLIDSSKFDLE
jgi:Trk K+ transport system NAD-binding subunit